jgi:acetylornithine deacetylase
VILEYVVDEEYSGNGTLACIQRGYRADAGISCEAGDLEIQPATTGSMWFEVDIEGKSASMSRRWEAVSAIEKGYRVCQAIAALEAERIRTVSHPLYPDPRGSLACFVGQFTAGSYPSAPPAGCSLRGRMGTLPGENPREAQRQLIEWVKREAEGDPWLKEHPPQVRFTGYYAEPAEIPADHPICQTIARAFREVMGRKAVIRGHDGAADSRFLIKYGNTPTVIFGPGTIAQMHADDEWVKLEDVITTTKVLALAILDWCGYVEG